MTYNILVLVFIVLVKAIFSSADTAFTYVNKFKISQLSKTNKKAKKIKILMENTNKFYGVIEVVITMCELLASAFAAEMFVNDLANQLLNFQISYGVALSISIIIITIILSYVLLIFGSVLPKRIARNNPERTAFKLVNIVWIMSKLNYPFEKLVSLSTKVFAKIFGINENPKDKLTEKEIKMIIMEGKEQGIVADLEKEIAFNALKFDDILVKNIMVPKEKVDFININDEKEKILRNIEKYKYTRIPVYEKNKDNVIGIFNIKDIAIEYAKNGKITFDLEKVLREVMFVNQNQKVSEVFKNMQMNNQLIAIALNDSREVMGLISMEDIIEKIVGQIADEFDKK